MNSAPPAAGAGAHAGPRTVRLFLCGDVMTGRGIDQVLPHPGRPQLFESWVRSAVEYVELAERASGRIGRGLDFDYPWGDALAVLAEQAPHVRIVNLETAVTTRDDAMPGKGIHYRMHPANLPCITRAGIDCCVLANNHVLDWGPAGLDQTLASLHAAGVQTAGAGATLREATAPAVIERVPETRVLVFAAADETSGVPAGWAATGSRGGIHFLQELSTRSADEFAASIAAQRRPGDVVVVSVHWGGNWGFAVPREQSAFAHRLVDSGAADIVWGHSSHHVKGIEVRNGRLILYGCGDLINDYEGITGQGDFRPELSLMYFPEIDRATGRLVALALVPLRMRRFRLERVPADGREWIRQTLDREGQALGTHVTARPDGSLALGWQVA